MKLRILRRSLAELVSIMSAATQSSPRGQYECGEPSSDGVMASLDIDIREGVFNALPEQTKQRLWNLDVRVNPYQAAIHTPGHDRPDFPGPTADPASDAR